MVRGRIDVSNSGTTHRFQPDSSQIPADLAASRDSQAGENSAVQASVPGSYQYEKKVIGQFPLAGLAAFTLVLTLTFGNRATVMTGDT